MIDQQTLKYFLRYNPETGNFRWNHSRGKRGVRHGIAGTIDTNGYNKIQIAGKNYKAARLVHLYMTGRWPEPTVDHINRIRHDDRWSNLREATYSQQMRNQRIKGCVPYKGVHLSQGKYFIARIYTPIGKRKYLGCFKNAELACAACQAAANSITYEQIK